MGNFKCIYYSTSSGRRPVEIFINRLSFRTQRKFFAKIEWLEEDGPKLPAPHAEKIDGDIYALRLQSEDGAIRILYFFYFGNKIVLLNGFKKKTKKLPKRELETAKSRKEEFLNKEK